MEEHRENVVQLRLYRGGGAAELPMFLELAEDWFRNKGMRLAAPDNARRHINHLKPIWRLTEKELRPSACMRALAELLQPNGPLGPSTVNKVRGTGKLIIRWAILNDRWAGINPFDVVDREPEPKRVHRQLSLEEIRAVLPHLREDWRRQAYMMLYLGMRPGEMKALRKEDVDTVNWTITIRRSNGRNQTKTGKERVAPIPEGLKPHLLACLEDSAPGCPFVCPMPIGRQIRTDFKLSRKLQHAFRMAGMVTGFEYICRRSGCGHRDVRQREEVADCPRCGFRLMVWGVPIAVRFYDLRHAASDLHRGAGAHPLAIQRLLGHAPENVTDSYYSHMTLEQMRVELNKLVI